MFCQSLCLFRGGFHAFGQQVSLANDHKFDSVLVEYVAGIYFENGLFEEYDRRNVPFLT